MLTDSFSTTPDSPQRFTEELIILDQPRLVYEAPDYAPPVSERPSLATTASAVEFALEGLHLSRRLNKTSVGRGGGRYSANLSSL